LRFGIALEQNLKAAIEQKAVEMIGADAAANSVGSFEDLKRNSFFLQAAGATEAGEPSAHDDYIGICSHSLEESSSQAGQQPMARYSSWFMRFGRELFAAGRATRQHCFFGDAVAVFKEALEFALDEPVSEKSSDCAQRQLVLDAVL
jgi:hypothetical protein